MFKLDVPGVPNRTLAVFEAIAACAALDEPVTFAALADETGLSRRTVVRHLRRLEALGYVQRRRLGGGLGNAFTVCRK